MLNNATELNQLQGPNISTIFYIVNCTRPFDQGIHTRSFPMAPAFVTSSKIIAAVNFLAAPPTLIANLLVFVAILSSKSLRSVSNVILLNVVVASLLQGLIAFPFHAAVIYLTSIRQYDCALVYIVSYSDGSVALASNLAVMVLAYDKFIAICNPFAYQTRLTVKRIMITSAVIWVFSLSSFFVITFVTSLMNIVVSIVTIIIIFNYIFNVIVHLKLFVAIRKRIREQATVAVGDSSTAIQKQIKETRAAKFAAYAICFLLFCYLPTVFKPVFLAMPKDAWMFYYLCDTILCLHGTFSPLLYCWQSPAIGKAVNKLCRCRLISSVQPSTQESDCRMSYQRSPRINVEEYATKSSAV